MRTKQNLPSPRSSKGDARLFGLLEQNVLVLPLLVVGVSIMEGCGLYARFDATITKKLSDYLPYLRQCYCYIIDLNVPFLVCTFNNSKYLWFKVDWNEEHDSVLSI